VYTHDELAFGFYVEATAKSEDDEQFIHWRNFRDRIQAKSPLRDALERVIAKHDLAFTDYYGGRDAPIGRFRSSKGTLQFAARGTDNWIASSLPEFGRAVAALSGEEWANLHIYGRMDREDAIKMGENVVGPILTVLDAFVPVYLNTIA
jgi:hypothetical protein